MKWVYRISIAIYIAILANAVMAVFGDVTLKRVTKVSTEGVPAAVFPHWAHRIRFKCYVCHDDIFIMQAGANRVTMDDVLGGKYCGACHNNQIAWGVSFDTCPRCHLGDSK